MSRSNPTPSNPAKRFHSWSGGKGHLVYWDKDEKKEFEVKLPFRFLVLDELHTIGGWSDTDKSSIWSNEVRDTNQSILTVRTASGELAKGTYAEIKDALKAKGGKYARSIYIAYQVADKEDGKWVIGHMKLTGAARGAWFDFKKAHNVEICGVKLSGSYEDKNGNTVFFVPTFEEFTPSDSDNITATILDEELQRYLFLYLQRHSDELPVVGSDPQPVAADVDVDIEDDIHNGKPVDLSEIPF